MKYTAQKSTLRQTSADVLVSFTFQDTTRFRETLKEFKTPLGNRLQSAAELDGFTGKDGELLVIRTERGLASPRLIVAGLGESKSLSLERLRRAAAAAAKQSVPWKVKRVAFRCPEPLACSDAPEASHRDFARAIAEGAALSLYAFDKYFTDPKAKKVRPTEIIIVHHDEAVIKAIRRELDVTRIICEGVTRARDLANAPGNEIFPESLALIVEESARKYHYEATVWDKDRISQEGFGGLLAVNSGSHRHPRFIITEYKGAEPGDATVVLVGKGITFDSGGISIKPSAGMAEMKMDMSGAAAVVGAVEATARLKLPVHLIGLIPSTENLPGGSAMRPGDVITHYGGKTSEVDNTDAEGRLILADALAYAATFKPAAVIDLATLTGACVVALGQHATGMMGNNDKLMAQLKQAGETTFERVWQLPLYEEYEKQIKSDIADVKNVGGRWAGAITAGLFLKKFIGDYRWVHLDIAGTAMLEETMPYSAKGGSGVGVRLLIEFLTRRYKA
jgi:leucyl aminopeptidase